MWVAFSGIDRTRVPKLGVVGSVVFWVLLGARCHPEWRVDPSLAAGALLSLCFLCFFFELARLLKPNGTAGSLLKPGDLSFQWSARGWAWPLGALHFVVVLVGRSFHLPQFTGSGDGGT